MPRKKRRSILPTGALLGLLLGAVIGPAVLSISTGIVALALWREAFDIVFGVLVLSFATLAVTGGFLAIFFLRRSARLAELQTDFIANVSHELRTPLAGIRLLVETLELGRADSPEQQTEVFRRLAAETHRLEELVVKVLQWRRLETGAYTLKPQQIKEVVLEALAPLVVTAQHTTLEVDIPEGLPAVEGDREGLVSAVRNLVHNAIKFGGDQGAIKVSARHDDEEIVIQVEDQGPGIAVREQKLIFEQFYRGPVRTQPGTGFGLAIVRRVVERHRGRLRLDSAPGKGSTFSLCFPLSKNIVSRRASSRSST